MDSDIYSCRDVCGLESGLVLGFKIYVRACGDLCADLCGVVALEAVSFSGAEEDTEACTHEAAVLSSRCGSSFSWTTIE